MTTEQEGMLVEIGVTEQRYLRQLAKLEAQTARAASRTQSNWEKANSGVSRSFRNAGKAGQNFSNGMRNVSLQLSQVAQQASATGDPIRALAIQLPDLTLGFGTLGIAAGVAAGALLPLAVDFLTAGTNAEDLGETIEGLGKSIERYKDAAARAAQPTSELREEYGLLAEQARDLFDAQAALEKLEVISNLQEVRAGLSNQFGSLAGFNAEDFRNAGVALEGLLARLKELRAGAEPVTEDEGQRIQAQINALGQLSEVVTRIQTELGLGAKAAGEFAASLAEFREAEAGTTAQAEALQRVRELLIAALTDSEALTDEQKELARKIVESEESLIGFVAAMTNASSATSSAASQASTLANEVSRAAQAALDFVNNLGSANLAGLRAEVASLEGGGSKADAAAARREAEIRASDEFQTAINGPSGVRDRALAGLKTEVQQARDRVLLNERRSTALRPASSTQSSSSGAASTDPGLFEATNEQIESLQRQQELLGQTQGRVAELQAKWELLAEAKRRNLDLDQQQADTGMTLREEINAQASAIGELTQKQAEAAEQSQFLQDAQRQLQDGFIDAIVEGESLIGVLEDLAKSLAKAALQAALFGDGPLAGAFGGSEGGLLGNILGSIFKPRAAGGPVSAGTPYQVGEHGRELFVPRTDGHIVNASQVRQLSSGGGRAPEQKLAVHIHENASDGETQVRQSPGRIDVFLRKMVSEQIRGGGADSAMRDRFGMRPKARGA